jgi:ABC-2 type transport system ATP-binding protein
MNQSAAVSLTNAVKRYDSTTVVDNFSFEVRSGEFVALLGPNGAGKTTSISMMLGLKHLTSGSAQLFGTSPISYEARARTGIMLQESAVPETLRVNEVVELFSRFYPESLETQSALDLAMLGKKSGSKVGDLSGGEKQRLFFALAVIGDPELLFLDEPSVGMDVTSRGVFWDRIRDMHARGKTIVLTTHYLEEADTLAERIVVLNHGRQVANGTPAEIKESFANRVVRFETPAPDEVFLRSLPGVERVTVNEHHVELVGRAVEDSVRELLNSPVPVANLEISGASLEQAFIALTA